MGHNRPTTGRAVVNPIKEVKPAGKRGAPASGYRAVTRDIEVNVEPFYMADRSDPEEGRYVWAYRITIDNQSEEFVKLLSRYWHITDGDGRVEEVRGPGVVGEQPELKPGDSYQYTSGCPLSTLDRRIRPVRQVLVAFMQCRFGTSARTPWWLRSPLDRARAHGTMRSACTAGPLRSPRRMPRARTAAMHCCARLFERGMAPFAWSITGSSVYHGQA